MNETLLWLLYLVSAAVAFLSVHRLRTRIVPAIIAGTLATMIGWAAIYFLTPEDLQPEFWRVDLSLNTSFGMVFAGAGAALGFFMAQRRGAPIRRTDRND